MVQQIFSSKAVLLIEAESLIDSLPSVVFITKVISLFFIRSIMCGLPSRTLLICLAWNPSSLRVLTVPLVPTREKLLSVKSSAISFMNCLSISLTLINAEPASGIITPAAISAVSYTHLTLPTNREV